ncbi:MAG: hypothetical protein Q7T85_13280 [Nitrosomonas sp.]|nr:hypothetical protein [Nitrosomonas sp.]
MREVLTQEVIKSSGVKIIKVKKPDYLGQSMWGFVYDGKFIEAKITHNEWLYEFQSRRLSVNPGDSLKVTLYEEISYGYEEEIVHKHYELRWYMMLFVHQTNQDCPSNHSFETANNGVQSTSASRCD